VSAWTTSLFLSTPLPGFPAESPITEKTVRVITRPTIGGQRLRVRLSNEFGTTPLTIAAAHSAHCADQSGFQDPAGDRSCLNRGNTPLHMASISGHKDIAELLLAHRAKAKAKNDDDATPLDWAARAGYKDIVELLRQHIGHE
jgi:hypothetical protein